MQMEAKVQPGMLVCVWMQMEAKVQPVMLA
jgi:hypothetical protein